MDKDLMEEIFRLALVIILGTLGVLYALSDVKADTFAEGAVGIFNSGKKSLSETKMVAGGIREPLLLGLSYQEEVGGWVDNAKSGRKDSAFASYQIGVEAGDYSVAHVFMGPCLISTPDSYLGGYFQFTEDFYLGLKGSNRNSVGLMYKHVSSAGLESPNQGRDFFGVETSIPF